MKKNHNISTMIDSLLLGILIVGGNYFHNGLLLFLAYLYGWYKLGIGLLMLILVIIAGAVALKEDPKNID